MYGDYGYFGSGMSGYAHYQQAFNESCPHYSGEPYMDAEYEPMIGSYSDSSKVNSVAAATGRRELTYKFSSIIIFSNGKAKYDMGSSLEQQLDRFAAALACRMVCRADLTVGQREMARSFALKAQGLPEDTEADGAYAVDFMNTAAELGKKGKSMKYVKGFVQSTYDVLTEVENALKAAYPDAGFGFVALDVMNELCDKASLEPVDIDYKDIERQKRENEDEFITGLIVLWKLFKCAAIFAILMINFS